MIGFQYLMQIMGNNPEMIFDVQGSSLTGQGTAFQIYLPQEMLGCLEVVLEE